MHYKNGRDVKVGDWVVGKTHNSENKILVGRVLELMPQQGPCNVRLIVFPNLYFESKREDGDETHGIRIWCGAERSEGYMGYKDDYADCKELIRVDDGLRMVHAVHGSGLWDGPYFREQLG